MPQLSSVLTTEDLNRRGKDAAGLDLEPYVAIMNQILEEGGVGGELNLSPEESQRTEKGRLTRAAKSIDRRLVWRKAPEGQLRFVLSAPDGVIPGARARRPKPAVVEETQAPTPKGRGRRKTS